MITKALPIPVVTSFFVSFVRVVWPYLSLLYQTWDSRQFFIYSQNLMSDVINRKRQLIIMCRGSCLPNGLF